MQEEQDGGIYHPGYPWMGQYELITVAIKKYENKYIIYWSCLIFCNYNIVSFTTRNVPMHGGGQIDASLIVVEKGAITVANMIFSL